MRKILVVDDEKMIVDIYATFLIKMGFEIIQAVGGKEACELLRSGVQMDLMILDMKMPNATGYDVLKVKNELGNASPVIIVSGSMGQGEDYKELEGFGFSTDDVIYKPVDLFILLQEIKKKLNMKI